MSLGIPSECTDCALSETRRFIVTGDGPSDTKIMFVARNPGKWEDRCGQPLVDHAKTGKEYNWLLARNGFQRSQVYTTNLVKCYTLGDRDPKPNEIEACSKWLAQELSIIKPKYVVTIGYHATNHFIPGVTLEMVHGIPFQRNNGQIVIPCYHPAAGFHQPTTMLQVQLDFRAVDEIIKGNRAPRHIEDEYAGKEEYYVLEDSDI